MLDDANDNHLGEDTTDDEQRPPSNDGKVLFVNNTGPEDDILLLQYLCTSFLDNPNNKYLDLFRQFFQKSPSVKTTPQSQDSNKPLDTLTEEDTLLLKYLHTRFTTDPNNKSLNLFRQLSKRLPSIEEKEEEKNNNALQNSLLLPEDTLLLKYLCKRFIHKQSNTSLHLLHQFFKRLPHVKEETPWNTPRNKDINNYFGRCVELGNGKYLGAPGQAGFDNYALRHTNLSDVSPAGEVNNELQMGLIFSNGGGLLIGLMFHYFCVYFKLYQNNKSMNPLYRSFKTLASVGATLGGAVALFIPGSDGAKKFAAAIVSNLACIIIGMLALPYWILRQYYFKITHKNDKPDDRQKNSDQIIGTEGWTKHGKTLLVFGVSLGQILGIAVTLGLKLSNTAAKTAAALWGGLTGVGLFVLGLILIPVINRLFKGDGKIKGILKLSDKDRDKFRNNYVRSFMTLALAAGTFIGAIIGIYAVPVLGATLGMILGGAIFSVAGGLLGGWKGHKITEYIQNKEHWNVGKNTENSWDYSTRTTSFIGASIGTLIGFFLPIPGGFLVGSAVGAALCGVLGWVAGLYVVKKTRELEPIERESTLLPWTQRITTGMNIGTVIGGILGLIGGLLGGPIGILGGALIGSAVGGLVGAAIAGSMGTATRPDQAEESIELTDMRVRKEYDPKNHPKTSTVKIMQRTIIAGYRKDETLALSTGYSGCFPLFMKRNAPSTHHKKEISPHSRSYRRISRDSF